MIDLNPLDGNFWPEYTFWSKVSQSFTSIASKATDWFKKTFSRRLLDVNGSIKVTMEANEVGEDLYVIGMDSGVETREAASKIIEMLSLSTLFLLCAF